MENQNLIHVKLEYSEALNAKKDMLSVQMQLLKIARIISNYKKIRSKGMRTKLKTYRRIIELKKDLSKMQKTLPKIKVPKIIRQEDVKEKHIEEIPVISSQYDKSLEIELRQIQDKLKKIERQTENF